VRSNSISNDKARARQSFLGLKLRPPGSLSLTWMSELSKDPVTVSSFPTGTGLPAPAGSAGMAGGFKSSGSQRDGLRGHELTNE
jgi:hypothetical protein